MLILFDNHYFYCIQQYPINDLFLSIEYWQQTKYWNKKSSTWDELNVNKGISEHRHYRRLILLLILLYCYVFRSYDHLQAENILLATITQLTTDSLVYTIPNIIVLTHLVIKDDHCNVSNSIKQGICCQLSNPS
jgi:hypothetical protein